MAINSTYSVPNRTSSFIKYMFCFILFGLLSLNGFGQTNEWTSRSYVSGNDDDWNNADNWSLGNVPTSSENVKIDYQTDTAPIIDGTNAYAKSITIYNDLSLTIQNGSELTVTDNFNTNCPIYISDSKLTIEDGSFKSTEILVDVSNSIIRCEGDFECGSISAVYTENYKPGESYLISIEGDFKTVTYNSSSSPLVYLVNARLKTNGYTSFDLEATGSTIYIDGDLNNKGDISLTDTKIDTDAWISAEISATDSTIKTNGNLLVSNELVNSTNSTFDIVGNWTSGEVNTIDSTIETNGNLLVSNELVNSTNSIFDIEGNWTSDPIISKNSTININKNLTIDNSDFDNYFNNTILIIQGAFSTKEGGVIENNCYISATDLLFDNAGGNSLYIDESELEFSNHVDNFIGDLILDNQSKLSCLSLTGANTGSRIQVFGQSTLIIENTFINYTTIHLDSGSSLIQTSEKDSNIVNNWNDTEQFTIDRNATIERNTDYVYWASPVQGFSVDNIGNTSLRYEWLPTVNNNNTYLSNFGNWAKTSGEMAPGQGYIVRGFPTINATNENEYTQRFQLQKPNNGTIEIEIKEGGYNGGSYSNGPTTTVVSNEDDNWNLLGNPYPSAISISEFLSVNQSLLDNGVRLWKHGIAIGDYKDPFYQDFALNYSSEDYLTYNETGPSTPGLFKGYIASSQGFFVTVKNGVNGSKVKFTNAMRQLTTGYTNSDFYREEASQKSRVWLSLIADETNSYNSMLLGYLNGATLEKDDLFDSVIMDYNIMSIHSLINEEPMVIQGRPLPFVSSDEVPLGVILKDKDLYTIGISQVDGLFKEGQDIYLEDLYTNTTHDLKASPYQFAAEAGTFNDRFILRYLPSSTLGIDDNITDSNFKIIATRNFIKVSSTTNTVNDIIIYDILGRVLYQAKNLNATEVKLDQFQPTNSPLIVKATLSNGTEKIQKVIY